MSFAVAAVGALLCLLAFAGAAFALFAARAVDGYRSAPAPALSPGEAPSVAVLKPLHGLEPGLEDDLASVIRQDYPGEHRVWLGLQREDDPARPLAERLAAGDRALLVVDGRRRGANAKVSNLLNLAEAAAPADIVVLSDSDIRTPPDYLRRLAAALSEPGVGVATCLYYGRAALPGFWPGLAAMGVSYGFLPLAAVGVQAGARPCMGSTVALRRETLERIGGLDGVKDVLADDYEIGRAVRRLRLEVVSPPFLVAHGSAETSLGELWRHELRWSKTTQGLDPLGHAGSVVTFPTPLALLGVALIAAGAPAMLPPALLTLAVALATRLWLKVRVDAAAGAATGPWWLLPVRDILSFAVFACAYLTRGVEWRGSRFHVGRGGELTPAAAPDRRQAGLR